MLTSRDGWYLGTMLTLPWYRVNGTLVPCIRGYNGSGTLHGKCNVVSFASSHRSMSSHRKRNMVVKYFENKGMNGRVEKTLKRWDCGLKKGDGKAVNALRTKYCAAIVESDVNGVREKIRQLVKHNTG
ncbi:hypothetical protein DM860_009724 [Cuscuta australis]|uniref:Uncharacterized protein n=1 Tax=Cuscuta australis TaxID=267555 RepID=A0A328DAT6_9ASTE|nr:hypothetical protein DM860_009724 [Cuscuta australis]